MGEADERRRIQLLLQVARAYYEQGQTQEQVAASVGYSRSFVSRLLTEAKEKGVVQFIVGHPVERQISLENQLATAFGLRRARVTASPPGGLPSSLAVAQSGADVLLEEVRQVTVLATSSGSTIDQLVRQLPAVSLQELHVVQMIGALARGNHSIDSTEIARRIAMRLEAATYHPMPAPLVVRSARMAKELQKEEAVANALALASHADVALMGIGALDVRGVSGQIFHGWMTAQESHMLASRGAVGHISAQHFDQWGEPIKSDLSQRVMSVPLERLAGITTVIGVASGAHKVAAILGALRGHHIDILVTDESTAQAVLQNA